MEQGFRKPEARSHEKVADAATADAARQIAVGLKPQLVGRELPEQAVSEAGREIRGLVQAGEEAAALQGEAAAEAEENVAALQEQAALQSQALGIGMLAQEGEAIRQATGNDSVSQFAEKAAEAYQAEAYEVSARYLHYGRLLAHAETEFIEAGGALEKLAGQAQDVLGDPSLMESPETLELVAAATIERDINNAEMLGTGLRDHVEAGKRRYTKEEAAFIRGQLGEAKKQQQEASRLYSEGKLGEAAAAVEACSMKVHALGSYVSGLDEAKAIGKAGKKLRLEVTGREGKVEEVTVKEFVDSRLAGMKEAAMAGDAQAAQELLAQTQYVRVATEITRFNNSRKGYAGKVGERLDLVESAATGLMEQGQFGKALFVLNIGFNYKATFEKHSYAGYAKKDETLLQAEQRIRKREGLSIREDSLHRARSSFARIIDSFDAGGEEARKAAGRPPVNMEKELKAAGMHSREFRERGLSIHTAKEKMRDATARLLPQDADAAQVEGAVAEMELSGRALERMERIALQGGKDSDFNRALDGLSADFITDRNRFIARLELPAVRAAYENGREGLKAAREHAGDMKERLEEGAGAIAQMGEGKEEVEGNSNAIAAGMRKGSVAAGKIEKKADEELKREAREEMALSYNREEGMGRIVTGAETERDVEILKAAVGRQQELIDEARLVFQRTSVLELIGGHAMEDLSGYVAFNPSIFRGVDMGRQQGKSAFRGAISNLARAAGDASDFSALSKHKNRKDLRNARDNFSDALEREIDAYSLTATDMVGYGAGTRDKVAAYTTPELEAYDVASGKKAPEGKEAAKLGRRMERLQNARQRVSEAILAGSHAFAFGEAEDLNSMMQNAGKIADEKTSNWDARAAASEITVRSDDLKFKLEQAATIDSGVHFVMAFIPVVGQPILITDVITGGLTEIHAQGELSWGTIGMGALLATPLLGKGVGLLRGVPRLARFAPIAERGVQYTHLGLLGTMTAHGIHGGYEAFKEGHYGAAILSAAQTLPLAFHTMSAAHPKVKGALERKYYPGRALMRTWNSLRTGFRNWNAKGKAENTFHPAAEKAGAGRAPREGAPREESVNQALERLMAEEAAPRAEKAPAAEKVPAAERILQLETRVELLDKVIAREDAARGREGAGFKGMKKLQELRMRRRKLSEEAEALRREAGIERRGEPGAQRRMTTEQYAFDASLRSQFTAKEQNYMMGRGKSSVEFTPEHVDAATQIAYHAEQLILNSGNPAGLRAATAKIPREYRAAAQNLSRAKPFVEAVENTQALLGTEGGAKTGTYHHYRRMQLVSGLYAAEGVPALKGKVPGAEAIRAHLGAEAANARAEVKRMQIEADILSVTDPASTKLLTMGGRMGNLNRMARGMDATAEWVAADAAKLKPVRPTKPPRRIPRVRPPAEVKRVEAVTEVAPAETRRAVEGEPLVREAGETRREWQQRRFEKAEFSEKKAMDSLFEFYEKGEEVGSPRWERTYAELNTQPLEVRKAVRAKVVERIKAEGGDPTFFEAEFNMFAINIRGGIGHQRYRAVDEVRDSNGFAEQTSPENWSADPHIQRLIKKGHAENLEAQGIEGEKAGAHGKFTNIILEGEISAGGIGALSRARGMGPESSSAFHGPFWVVVAVPKAARGKTGARVPDQFHTAYVAPSKAHKAETARAVKKAVDLGLMTREEGVDVLSKLVTAEEAANAPRHAFNYNVLDEVAPRMAADAKAGIVKAAKAYENARRAAAEEMLGRPKKPAEAAAKKAAPEVLELSEPFAEAEAPARARKGAPAAKKAVAEAPEILKLDEPFAELEAPLPEGVARAGRGIYGFPLWRKRAAAPAAKETAPAAAREAKPPSARDQHLQEWRARNPDAKATTQENARRALMCPGEKDSSHILVLVGKDNVLQYGAWGRTWLPEDVPLTDTGATTVKVKPRALRPYRVDVGKDGRIVKVSALDPKYPVPESMSALVGLRLKLPEAPKPPEPVRAPPKQPVKAPAREKIAAQKSPVEELRERVQSMRESTSEIADNLSKGFGKAEQELYTRKKNEIMQSWDRLAEEVVAEELAITKGNINQAAGRLGNIQNKLASEKFDNPYQLLARLDYMRQQVHAGGVGRNAPSRISSEPDVNMNVRIRSILLDRVVGGRGENLGAVAASFGKLDGMPVEAQTRVRRNVELGNMDGALADINHYMVERGMFLFRTGDGRVGLANVTGRMRVGDGLLVKLRPIKGAGDPFFRGDAYTDMNNRVAVFNSERMDWQRYSHELTHLKDRGARAVEQAYEARNGVALGYLRTLLSRIENRITRDPQKLKAAINGEAASQSKYRDTAKAVQNELQKVAMDPANPSLEEIAIAVSGVERVYSGAALVESKAIAADLLSTNMGNNELVTTLCHMMNSGEVPLHYRQAARIVLERTGLMKYSAFSQVHGGRVDLSRIDVRGRLDRYTESVYRGVEAGRGKGAPAKERVYGFPKERGREAAAENYIENNVAMKFGDRLLVYDQAYLLWKHGAEGKAAGSKLAQVNTPKQLAEILKKNVDGAKLAETEGVTRIANIETGEVTGRDAMVEITSIREKGKEVGVGSELKEGVEYEATVRDATGAEHPAIVKYEVVRPASEDGKIPAIMQPVAYTLAEPPQTTKINVVIGKIELADPRAEWVNEGALRKRVGNKAVDDAKGVYSIFTIFSGEYAPPAGERAVEFDATVRMTGNEFWNGRKASSGKARVNRHALMRKPSPEMAGKLEGSEGAGEALAGAKLRPGSEYIALEKKFPAVEALKGMDQKVPKYHALTADAHSRELADRFTEQPIFKELSAEERGWAKLAANIHAVGKAHPDGMQVNRETGKVSYKNHESVGARIVENEILPELEISQAGSDFVLAIVEHHPIARKLIESFEVNNQPKGKRLRAYDKFVSAVDRMPGSETREGRIKNLRVMIDFAKADSLAGVSKENAASNPKMVERIKNDIKQLNELEKALPAIVEAVEQRRAGKQQAGVVHESGEYRYRDFEARGAKPGAEAVPAYNNRALGNALDKAGIPRKAIGVLSKTAESKLPEALGKEGFTPEQIPKILELAAEHKTGEMAAEAKAKPKQQAKGKEKEKKKEAPSPRNKG